MTVSVPKAASSQGTTDQQYTPDQLNPDLAAAKMAQDMIARLGTPSIISKPFAVTHGMFSALNHDDVKNKTGYNCSLRIKAYDAVAANSVNINGNYMERFWAFMMKPKYIIQGMPLQGSSAFEQKEPGLIDKVRNWWSGGNNTQCKEKRSLPSYQ